MSGEGWAVIIPVKDSLTAGNLRELSQKMKKQPGVDAWPQLDQGEIHVKIIPEHFWLSGNAPPGTHEFARGFILAMVCLELCRISKTTLDFQRFEFSEGWKVSKTHDDGIRVYQNGHFDFIKGMKEGKIEVVEAPHPTELAA